MNASLLADSISKSWSTRRILTAARLMLYPGRLTYLAGRNGTGKSTLVKVAAGVISADSGFVEFAGKRYQRPRLSQLARQGLFYLPDREILSRGLRLRDQFIAMSRRFGRGSFDDLVETFTLKDLINRAPYTFSAGELRRAEVCIAIYRGPTCFLADEPLRGMDPKDAELIVQQLRVLAQSGAAVLVSGHNSRTLLEAADEVVWVTSGTTYTLGSPAEAMATERFRKEYLSGTWIQSSYK